MPDWRLLEAELERLLRAGQAAPIQWMLQSRFVGAVSAEPEPIWAAFGYAASLRFLQSIGDEFRAWDREIVEEFQRTIDDCTGRPVPPFAREGDWEEAWRAAATALERERYRLAGLMSGLRTAFLARLTVEAQLLDRRAPHAGLTVRGTADPETLRRFEVAVQLLSSNRSTAAPSPGHYWFQVGWDPPAARLTGRSATLALLLAARSAREAFSLGMSHRGLPGDLAVAGDVVGDEIRPVESIREKVRGRLLQRSARLGGAGTAAREFALRIGESEYPFDEDGYARLDAFPVGTISLIVR